MRSSPPDLPEQFFETERANIQGTYLDKVETTVADIDGVAGFISLLGHNVAALFVHPDHQGCGIGSALLTAFKAPLRLEVFEANQRARAFYHRHGFRQTGTRVHEETGEVLLLLALDGAP
ncbi:MAG: GNAT family N-acetyltransferase [Litoreibacter sp.]|nr:GNAT family N-acetyltransferase [Litoreibacter sp.]